MNFSLMPATCATNGCRTHDHTFENLRGRTTDFSSDDVLLLTRCRAEFHKNQGVGKKDFGTIEYLLRRGRRQLETYQDPGIKDLH